MKGLTKTKMPPIIDQTRPDQLIVSFCIPVYNNAEAAEKIVNGILCSDNTRFEVVVSDDASTDDAEERLLRIHDSRFKYFRNEKNLGAHKNWEHALEFGRGEYLYLVMGRDKLRGENIDILIDLLETARRNNVTYLKDDYDKSILMKNRFIMYEGIDAIINLAVSDHQTGSIFSSKAFRAIPDRTKYFEISDMYPDVYVKRDLLMNGRGARLRSGVNMWGRLINYTKVKSTVEHDISIFDTYFAPVRRIKQTFEMIDMIEIDLQGKFNHHEINKLFCDRFSRLLSEVTIAWKYAWCGSPYMMAHYGQKARYVGIKEMRDNIMTAYNETIMHLKDKGLYTSSKRIIMNYCIAKITVRILARSILEPLGIWNFLKRIRRKYIRGYIKG